MIIIEDIKTMQNMSEKDLLQPLMVDIGQGWYIEYTNGEAQRWIYLKKELYDKNNS